MQPATLTPTTVGTRDYHFSAKIMIDNFPNLVGAPGGKTKFIRNDLIGKGSFGEAWVVTRREDEQRFVAKVMDLSKMSSSAVLRARSEVACLASCDHFACVRFVEDYNANGCLLIIMEYCDAGDLNFQLTSMKEGNDGVPKGFEERDVKLILLQLVLALNHMHRRKMLHRDIKAANVLLSTTGLVKLGDFGLSRAYDETISDDVAKTFCGTPYYLAPEVWKHEKYGAKADIWSLGIMTYEILTGCIPFRGSTVDELKRVVCEGPIPGIPNISAPLADLIKSMLEKDPKNRPNVRTLLDSPYMREALQEFPKIVKRTRRLTEAERNFVLAGVAEADEPVVTPSSTPAPVSYEGPVGKYKDGRFENRYMILRDGYMEVRKDKDKKSSNEPRPVSMIEHVAVVPISQGSNVVDSVFEVTISNKTYWFTSKDRDVWIAKLRESMRIK